jgi:3-hydroxybutyryl-CoA dehydrogenase
MKVKSVTVVGAGVMGRQIALVAALSGFKAVLNDVSSEALKSAGDWMETYLKGRVEKGKIDQAAADKAKGLLSYESDLTAAVKDADLVIEAIVEQLEIKRGLFAQLDQLAKPEAILATNSSFIPSSQIADATKRPGKIANLHFFNPATVMKLAEVVKGEHTDPETAGILRDFAAACGKDVVMLNKEIDGFIVNRLQRAITEEAFFLVENGYVTPQEVDTAAEKGLNYPLGPFRLMDMTGIDISYLSRLRRFESTGDPKEKPPAFLEEKYKKGELGKKTGKGWYDYGNL